MSAILDAILDETPAEDLRLFDLCDGIADRIEAAMRAKDGGRGWTQRQLAERLGKKESYVSRALAGGVNFTLRTITQFEIALGVNLVAVATSSEGRPVFRGTVVAANPTPSTDAANDYSTASKSTVAAWAFVASQDYE